MASLARSFLPFKRFDVSIHAEMSRPKKLRQALDAGGRLGSLPS
jgi:hypothetical protein